MAEDWIAWARTPGHDAYWEYREAFFALLPEPGPRVLEIGCGEGRVTRDLRRLGHDPDALDASRRLVAAAAAADPAGGTWWAAPRRSRSRTRPSGSWWPTTA